MNDRDHVLMLDARPIYRKVTRKIYDFSPEQMRNLSAIVWLYRGQQARFVALVRDYLASVCTESEAVPDALAAFETTLADLRGGFTALADAAEKQRDIDAEKSKAFPDAAAELRDAEKPYEADRAKLLADLDGFRKTFAKALPEANDKQHVARKAFDPIIVTESCGRILNKREQSRMIRVQVVVRNYALAHRFQQVGDGTGTGHKVDHGCEPERSQHFREPRTELTFATLISGRRSRPSPGHERFP